MSARRVSGIARGARLAFVLAMLALTSACMSTPRNGQHYSDVRQDVFFSGRVIVASQRVDVQLRNRQTGAWVPFRSFYAGTSAYVDASGTPWYEWGGSARIPTDYRYWEMTPGSPADAFSHMRVNVRAVSADGTVLDTFDVNADGCVNSHLGEGIASVIVNCRSSSTPVASITASCGSLGTGCCLWNICQPGMLCSADQCVPGPAPVSYAAVEDYPFSEDELNWSNHPQGAAADSVAWYVVHSYRGSNFIGWSPLATPLGHHLPEIRLPAIAGWDHHGDPDVYRGRVYIPLENNPSRGHAIASVDAAELRTLGAGAPVRIQELPAGTGHAAWVAISPLTRRLYTASEYDAVTHVDEYDFVDDASGCCGTYRDMAAAAQSTAYRAWQDSYTAAHCADHPCPSPPVPDAPPDCLFDLHCAAGRCDNACTW